MDEARQKSLEIKSQPVISSVDANVVSAASPVSHDDSVSKALDLFDPNAK